MMLARLVPGIFWMFVAVLLTISQGESETASDVLLVGGMFCWARAVELIFAIIVTEGG